MKLSVIIPALNEEATIHRAISSCWTAEADEVIVADGGSRDQTVSIAESCGATVVSSAAGRGIQLNAGVEQADGDVLMFLHADNWLSDSIGKQLSAFFDFSKGDYCCFRQRIDAAGWIYRAIEWGNTMRAQVQKLPYGDQAVCVSRRLFESVGNFKEIPLMEDVDIATRLSKIASPKVLEGPLYVCGRRWQKHGPILQTFRNWLTMLRYRFGASPTRLSKSYNNDNRVLKD